MTMGDRIHYLRTLRGFTLQELGDKVGVGASTVRKWEIGHIKALRTDKIEKLSNALGTTVDYLLGWSENSDGPAGHDSDVERSKEEAELLRIFNNLDVRRRLELLMTAIRLEEESK